MAENKENAEEVSSSMLDTVSVKKVQDVQSPNRGKNNNEGKEITRSPASSGSLEVFESQTSGDVSVEGLPILGLSKKKTSSSSDCTSSPVFRLMKNRNEKLKTPVRKHESTDSSFSTPPRKWSFVEKTNTLKSPSTSDTVVSSLILRPVKLVS